MSPRGAVSRTLPSVDWVTSLALAYLAVPNLLFYFGWFRLPVAVCLAAALVFLLSRPPTPGDAARRFPDSIPVAATLLVIGLLWAAFGGGSHFGYANSDWQVRDAVLGDLTYGRWPAAYGSVDEGQPLLLRSAFGFFLLPALIGKWLGTSALELVVFVWTGIGVALFLALLPLPRRPVWALAGSIAVVIFFSGADVLGFLVTTGEFPEFPGRMAWWTRYSYPSLSGQLLWAPNHAIPTWIVTALIFRHRDDSAILKLLLAALPLSLIWTPFAAIGVLPFAGWATAGVLRRDGLDRFPWVRLGVACGVAALTTWFLTLDIQGISRGPAAAAAPPHAAEYLLFATFEFGLIVIALFANIRQHRDYLLLATAVLLALPSFSYGPSNDAALRLSAPALVILAILCIEVLGARTLPLSILPFGLLVLVLAIGANTGISELGRAVLFPRWRPDYTLTLQDRQGGQPAAHYAGHLNSPLLRRLLNDAHPVPSRSLRRAPGGALP